MTNAVGNFDIFDTTHMGGGGFLCRTEPMKKKKTINYRGEVPMLSYDNWVY